MYFNETTLYHRDKKGVCVKDDAVDFRLTIILELPIYAMKSSFLKMIGQYGFGATGSRLWAATRHFHQLDKIATLKHKGRHSYSIQATNVILV